MSLRRPRRDEPGSPLDALMRAVATRPHTRAELRRKLAARGHAPDAIDAALARAEELHLLEPDAELASRDAARRARRPLATPTAVAARLRARGLSAPEVREAVRDAFEGWDARAAALAGVRPGEPPARVARRLAARGFEAAVIAWVLRRLGAETPDV